MNDTKSLITAAELNEAVLKLGVLLSEQYKGKNPLIVGVLKGSFIFISDLVRAMDIDCEIDFMAASSYGARSNSSGNLQIIKDLDTNIRGRHVIVVEDIIDSGVTLSRLLAILQKREPQSLYLATLLDKPARRQANVDVDYACFTVPDEFLVGYGLDYNEKYRNLPDISILAEHVYSE